MSNDSLLFPWWMPDPVVKPSNRMLTIGEAERDFSDLISRAAEGLSAEQKEKFLMLVSHWLRSDPWAKKK